MLNRNGCSPFHSLLPHLRFFSHCMVWCYEIEFAETAYFGGPVAPGSSRHADLYAQAQKRHWILEIHFISWTVSAKLADSTKIA